MLVGQLHLLIVTDSYSIEQVKTEFDHSIKTRLKVLKNSGVHIGSPLETFDEKNMTRIAPFDIILPRRYLFKLGSQV